MQSPSLRSLLLASILAGGFWWGLSTSPAQAKLANVSPSVNEQDVAPSSRIYGVFQKSGTNDSVDETTVKILLDGTDVTKASLITRDFFSYTPTKPLSPGKHTVRVQYTYRNKTPYPPQVWSFTVLPPQALVKIDSVTHNATGESLGVGTTFIATITGTPSAKGSVVLVDGAKVQELMAQEVKPGIYIAALNLTAQDRINQGIVVGRLEKNGEKIYSAAAQAVVFQPEAQATAATTVGTPPSNTPTTPPSTTPPTSTIPLKPVFTSHQDQQRITGQGFRLQGTTQPGAQVKVIVTSPFFLGAETLADTSVTADAAGVFTVQVPAPIILNSGRRYDIRAIATKDGQQDQSQMVLIQQ